ncbi:hypothetical protein [Rhizobium sp. WYCCWR10014]|uniref:hypothetical protein n=1 Tax=Rhizobium sp. WYCCWR10014 TaxID=1825933 RepID=UPI0012E723EB|nr:hypothetical protein [Rhizobium sp. WYCCWR10014]
MDYLINVLDVLDYYYIPFVLLENSILLRNFPCAATCGVFPRWLGRCAHKEMLLPAPRRSVGVIGTGPPAFKIPDGSFREMDLTPEQIGGNVPLETAGRR